MADDGYIGFADDLVTTQQFADKAGYSRQWIHKQWQDGKIGFNPVRIADRLYWQAVDVDDYVDRHGVHEGGRHGD